MCAKYYFYHFSFDPTHPHHPTPPHPSPPPHPTPPYPTPPHSDKKTTTTDTVKLTKTYEQKLAQLQAQLSLAQKEAAEVKLQRVQWEDEKTVFLKQKRAAESELVRMGKAHEQKMATWQVRIQQWGGAVEAMRCRSAGKESEQNIPIYHPISTTSTSQFHHMLTIYIYNPPYIYNAHSPFLLPPHPSPPHPSQAQLALAHKKASDVDRHRAAADGERAALVEQKKALDAAGAQLSRTHEVRYGSAQRGVGRPAVGWNVMGPPN